MSTHYTNISVSRKESREASSKPCLPLSFPEWCQAHAIDAGLVERMSPQLDRLIVGDDLYYQVRAGLVERRSTFNAWCRKHGFSRGNARKVFTGWWMGEKGRAVLVALLLDAGVLPKGEL